MLSLLQLDTAIERIAGDVGSAATFVAAPQVIRVPAATVAQVVTRTPSRIDIAPFETALQQASGDVIATSCGFLAPFQDHLAGQTDRPFVASALSALDHLSDQVTPKQIMIVTFAADQLGPAHFGRHDRYLAATVGLPVGSHLRQVITDDTTSLDPVLAQDELTALVRRHLTPAHRHILLECTNLPPYKSALRAATGLPISDILTQIERARPGTVAPAFL